VLRTPAEIGVTEKDAAAALSGRQNKSANGAVFRVEDDRDARDPRRDLLERLQPLGRDRELETGEAGEIAARMRQVRHETLADRIGHLREHDRDSVALLLQSGHHGRAVGQD
jgi:hypothetical protein